MPHCWLLLHLPPAHPPCSCTGGHWLNLSLTIVDSLDTLYLLGMHREFEEAARCVWAAAVAMSGRCLDRRVRLIAWRSQLLGMPHLLGMHREFGEAPRVCSAVLCCSCAVLLLLLSGETHTAQRSCQVRRRHADQLLIQNTP